MWLYRRKSSSRAAVYYSDCFEPVNKLLFLRLAFIATQIRAIFIRNLSVYVHEAFGVMETRALPDFNVLSPVRIRLTVEKSNKLLQVFVFLCSLSLFTTVYDYVLVVVGFYLSNLKSSSLYLICYFIQTVD